MKKYRHLIIVIVLAFGLLFLPLKASEGARNLTWQIVRPLGLGFNKTVGHIFPFFNNLFHFRQIVKQNSDLIGENLELQSRLAQLSEMANENAVLKKELGFLQTQNSSTTLPAAIIGRSTDYLKSIVIDKGEESGVRQGDAVISQGILIGTVTSVRANNAEVTMITDYNSLIPVNLQTSGGNGLLRGGLGGLVIEDIPLNIQMVVGENVVTSGLGGQIPAGILVGKLNSATSSAGEIFQKANISSSIDFSRLEVVVVVI